MLVLASATTVAACAFDADYRGTALKCSAAAPACPDGYACVADVCVTGGAIDAAASGDGPGGDGAPGPDAGVCDLAAQVADNDGCGAAINLTSAALTPGGTIAYGDTRGYANDLVPTSLTGCTGSPEPGPDAIYRLTLAAGDTLTATLESQGWTGAIYVIDACSSTAACKGGAASFAQATAPITVAGTYYLVVDSTGAAGCFALSVAVVR